MRDVFDGATVAFECLGAVKVPSHRFLDAITDQGKVVLSPGFDPPFTGTHWRCLSLDGGTFALISAGAVPGFRYLDGRTQDGVVQTVGDTNPPFSGTRWLIRELSPGVVTIHAEGDFHNPEHQFLDGNTQGGFAGLARSTDFPFTGTRWATVAQPSASLQVSVTRNQLGADLNFIGSNYTPHDRISVVAEDIVGFGGDRHGSFVVGTSAVVGGDGRFEAPARVDFRPKQPGDIPVILRATDLHGRTASQSTSAFTVPGN